jgi:amyloid beta precursor protein binding protein 1
MMANNNTGNGADQQKYDRQLRLWGVHGQKRLMNSHVCLLNAGPTGTEALKNLVLPGIGQLTVVDPHMVSEFDCSNNFFVDESFIGKPRAEAVKSLLVEMNTDVKGNAVVKDPKEIIRKDPAFFSKFTLVLATQMDEQTLIALGDICAQSAISLVIARTYGLIGHVRLFSSEHRVVELKPSPEPAPDLRVFNPFPALKALADSIDFSKMDGFEFKHVPFVLVLIKLLDEWKAKHEGNPPENYTQKEEFKKTIKSIARLPWGEEENLVEAVSSAFQAFAKYRVNDEVHDIMKDSKCDNLDNNTPNFWIMACALREFFKENHGLLPLPGTLPDMTSTTDRFIQLQNCFSAKAQEDLKSFSTKVDTLLKQLGKPLDTIPQDERGMFCANASGLVVIRDKSLKDEFMSPVLQDYGFDPMETPESMHPITWYLMWRACDAIFAKIGKYPGQKPDASENELAKDADALMQQVKQMVETQYKTSIPESALDPDVAIEMVRYGACEMHNVAALIGGIAAEECVKLLTQQYQPLNNTFLYNGINSIGKFFQM